MPTSILGLSVGAAGLLAAVLAAVALWIVHAKKKDMWKVIGVVGIVAVFIGGGIQSSYSDLSAVATSEGGSAKAVYSTPASNAAMTPSNAGCNVAPAITYTVVDKYNQSTPIAGTNRIKVNNAPPVAAYATGAGGDSVEYLPTAGLWFGAPIKTTLPCGATQIIAETQDNSTGGHTYNIFNDIGNVISNNQVGGTENVTVGSGGAKNLRLEFTAPRNQAVAPFGAAYCFEVSSKTVFDTSKSGFSGTPTPAPQRITLANAGGQVNCVEDNTPLSNGAVISKSIAVSALPGQNPGVGGPDSVYVHIVPKSWFSDIDGTFKLGYQNSNNVDQTKNDYQYRVFVD